jgi:hypothetical protein
LGWRWRKGIKLRRINLIHTYMNPIHNCIEEQRWAMLEMRILLNQVQSTYGNNPPADILLAIAQIAKANRTKSTPHVRKLNHTIGIEEFCTKNDLSLG